MRKIVGIIALGASVAIIWYVFVRAHEFEVNFVAKTSPGDIIQTLRIWNKSLTNTTSVTVDSMNSLSQEIQWKNRSYLYLWNFVTVDDSTTRVRVLISEKGNELTNKLLVPISAPAIETDAAEIVKTFHALLQVHLQITKVKIVGLAEIPPTFCVCRSITTAQTEKAYGMMKDYDILTSIVSSHHLEANGPPIVRVNEWSHTADRLAFDFCFPIKKTQAIPAIDSVAFKEFEKQKALKAEYHGNYITSDRAWYALISAAREAGYNVTGFPIEYFHHNPNLGLNERQWKADVYLPVE